MANRTGFWNVFKLVLIVGAIYGGVKFVALRERGKDFNVCDIQSLQLADMVNKPLSVQPDIKQMHDQVDDLISTCMMEKGYDYDPSGWERCPTEKLSMCYRKPSFFETIISFF